MVLSREIPPRALALAAPAAAQTADGWDVRADPASGVIVAGAAFDSGLAIIFRCQANSLDAILTGLPAGDPGGRRLELSFAGAEFEPQGWINAEQLAALADPLKKNGYGQYLLSLLKEKVF